MEVLIEVVAGLLECIVELVGYACTTKEERKTRKAVRLEKKKKK